MKKSIKIISLDSSLGAGSGGVDLGPSAIRYAGLHNSLSNNQFDFEDVGSIHPSQQGEDLSLSEQIITVSKILQDKVADTLDQDAFPLVLGGDHSSVVGTVMGLAQTKKVGIFWFDAHGDANTFETSISQNIHGMSMSILLGDGNEAFNTYTKSLHLKGNNIALIGARSFDEGELAYLEAKGVQVYTAQYVKANGVEAAIEAALKGMDEDIDGIHVSFDLDALDPVYAPGGGLRVENGLTPSDVREAFELISKESNVLSAEFSEVNPLMDVENLTATLSLELINHLLMSISNKEVKI